MSELRVNPAGLPREDRQAVTIGPLAPFAASNFQFAIFIFQSLFVRPLIADAMSNPHRTHKGADAPRSPRQIDLAGHAQFR
jgi:hypothetical protein